MLQLKTAWAFEKVRNVNLRDVFRAGVTRVRALEITGSMMVEEKVASLSCRLPAPGGEQPSEAKVANEVQSEAKVANAALGRPHPLFRVFEGNYPKG
jgi:hypothetical protein